MIGGPPELNEQTRKGMRSMGKIAFVVFAIFAAGLLCAVYVWASVLTSG